KVRGLNDMSMVDFETIVNRVTEMIASIARMDPAEIDRYENLIELGADSIILTDINSLIREEFKIEIPVTLYFEQLTSVAAIADYNSEHQSKLKPMEEEKDIPQSDHEPSEFVEAEQQLAGQQEIAAAKKEIIASGTQNSNGLERLFSQQLEIINNQLHLL